MELWLKFIPTQDLVLLKFDNIKHKPNMMEVDNIIPIY